jgi:hypothetical protein
MTLEPIVSINLLVTCLDETQCIYDIPVTDIKDVRKRVGGLLRMLVRKNRKPRLGPNGYKTQADPYIEEDE